MFYGWYILAISMLGAFLSAGASQLFMSIMLKPITEELGWSRTVTTGAITVGSILGGLLSPLIGPLADRYGPRPLATLGALGLVGLYFALASLAELWQFYAVYVLGRALTAATLAGVVPMTAATNWFRRKRGRALGLVAMCTPLGGAVLALIGQAILEGYGWRLVFLVFGVATLVLLVPPAALVLRRRPEDLGLQPDGVRGAAPLTTHASPDAGDGDEEGGWTLAEALRTRTLWLLIAAGSLLVTANTAVGFHQVAYYTDVGIAATAAVVALSVYAFAGALANGLWGWLTERFPERPIAVVATLLSALAIFYLLSVQTAAGALGFAVLFGLTSRGESTLVNIILAQYYGRQSFGAISGFVNPFLMVGLGIGPLLGAVVFDLAHSYHAVFLAFGGTSVLAAALLWLARRPALPAHLRARQAAAP
jgi:OFA family oxalate/formate antiporter-like MFS transporter